MTGNVVDWEYWYHKLMSLAHEDESMRFAINTIDEIHDKYGAFKHCDAEERKDLNWALDKLESTSDYELFTAAEEMIEYFGFRDLEESKKVKKTVIEKCQNNRSGNKMRRLFKESAKLYDVLIVFENDGEDELFMNAAEELAPKGLYDGVSIWSDNHGAVQIYHVDIAKVSAFIEAAYDASFLSQIGCEMPREVRVYPEGELITLFA